MSREAVVRRLAAVGAAVALALSVSACAPVPAVRVDLPAQADDALPEGVVGSVHAAVERAMAATGSTGAIVGVWVPGVGSSVQALGVTRPGGAEVAADMSFPIAAVTRSMTCDVLHGMVADGIVALGDSVTTWTTGLPDAKGITLGELCDGTSGLGSYAPQLEGRWLAKPDRVWNPRELASYGLGATLPGAPGTVFRDSDTAYVVLGMALERASGKTAAELYDHYVFEPLGLSATALSAKGAGGTRLTGLRVGATPEGAVDCAEPVEVGVLSASAGYTASGVVSTIDDLGRYAQALALGARSYDSAKRWKSPLPAYADAPSWYTATGGAYQAGSLVGQFGSVPGYLTAAFADRNTGTTVAVVLNNSSAQAGVILSLAWELAALASKVPVDGDSAAGGLPWTAEQYAAAVEQAAVCPLPQAEPEAEPEQ